MVFILSVTTILRDGLGLSSLSIQASSAFLELWCSRACVSPVRPSTQHRKKIPTLLFVWISRVSPSVQRKSNCTSIELHQKGLFVSVTCPNVTRVFLSFFLSFSFIYLSSTVVLFVREQTLPSPSYSNFVSDRTAHARFLSDTTHCPMVTSKSCLSHGSVWQRTATFT